MEKTAPKSAKTIGIIQQRNGTCTIIQCFDEESGPGFHRTKRRIGGLANLGKAIELADRLSGRSK